LGVVQIGDNITITSGKISIPLATSSTIGVVYVSTGPFDTVDGAGLLDLKSGVDISEANTFTKAQIDQLNNIGSVSGNQNPDWSESTVQEITLTGNLTLDVSPTNMVVGGKYVLICKQDATGSRLITFSTAYIFESGA